jgi:DivIVA domain-containing protein
MAATRLDHPVLMSADQIRRREFVTTRRGYDPDQVRHYLEELAEQVELMASMIRDARMEAESAIRASSQPYVDPYERLAGRVASLLREADETADRLRIEGRREAEHIMLEARTDADRVRTDAQAKAEQARTEAERALQEARDQADRTISGLATRRESLVGQLAQMQERLLGVAHDLESAIEAPMDMDEATPDPRVEAAENEVVIVRAEDASAEPASEVRRIVADDILDGLDDPTYEELWDGTETIPLDVPDIPPLDLSWGDDGDDEPDPSS